MSDGLKQKYSIIYMTNLVFYTNCQCRGLFYFLQKHIDNLKVNHIENYSLIKNKRQIN